MFASYEGVRCIFHVSFTISDQECRNNEIQCLVTSNDQLI